jgi:hypothetical protein
MKQGKYESLRDVYPEKISLDHLRTICRISKRSAKYLVEHGIIPAHDTGKKTWRFLISLDDVITYLRRREQVGSMIPRGVATSRKRKKPSNLNTSTRASFSKFVTPGQESEVSDFFNYIYADCGEVLTSDDIAEMTGLPKNVILKFLKSGLIKSIMSYPRYLVPKPYLLEFVVTPRFIEYRTNTELFKKIVGGFEIWIKAKS